MFNRDFSSDLSLSEVSAGAGVAAPGGASYGSSELIKAGGFSDLLTPIELEFGKKLLANISFDNLDMVFAHYSKDEDQLRRYFFHNGQNNDGFFLLNVVLSNKVQTLRESIRQEHFETLIRLYESIASPNTVLRFCWAAFMDGWSGPSPKGEEAAAIKLIDLINEVSTNTSLFHELLSAAGGFKLFRKHLLKFCVQGFFKVCVDDGRYKGLSPFYWLAASNEGREILRDDWDNFKNYLSTDVLFKPCMDAGPYKGKSPFYWLAGTPEGREILSMHWPDIREYLSKEGLFQSCEDEAADKGIYPFYCLVASPDGRKILRENWSDFRRHLIHKDLFQPCMGDNRLLSPFYWLAASSKGREILHEHWDEFKAYLSADNLFQVCVGDGPDAGKSPFYWLAASSEGREILRTHWSDFSAHLSKEGLFQICRADSPDKGKNIFYWLAGTTEGQEILLKYWSDFRAHLSKEGLFQVCEADGPYTGISPFYWLTGTDKGREILVTYWSDFRAHLSKEGLFQVCRADSPEQGISPFYWLAASPEGREILRTHWSDFRAHLSKEGLFKVCEANGPDKGKSPFGWLALDLIGKIVLYENWDDFIRFDFLSNEGIFRYIQYSQPKYKTESLDKMPFVFFEYLKLTMPRIPMASCSIHQFFSNAGGGVVSVSGADPDNADLLAFIDAEDTLESVGPSP